LTDPGLISGLNRQASILGNVFFPAQVLAALSLDDTASVTAVRLFLLRFREEAGPRSVREVRADLKAVRDLIRQLQQARAAVDGGWGVTAGTR
jgi:hypothetical protein